MSTALFRALLSVRPRGSRIALFFAVIFAIACSPPAPPTVVANGPQAPVLVVAASASAPAQADPEEPFVDDPDPGPVPIRANDPWLGRRDAPVTIVEFADFQCPFCQRVTGTLAEVQRRFGPDKVRLVWKHLPLPFHPHAKPAAIVTTLLFERFGNRAFWDAHDTFFSDQKDLAAQIDRETARLGLTPEDIAEMARGPEGKRIDAGVEEANRLGPRGTPAFLINGVYLSGAQPIEKFTEIIEQQLSKATGLMARGVPRARVYAELSKAQWTAQPPLKASTPPDDNSVNFVPIGKSPVRGSANALVTLVEFAEFQCPFCGRVEATIEKLRARYGADLRVVWKHNPLPFHKAAFPAAVLSIEARAQKGDQGFWKAHDLLFRRECVGDPKAANKDECEANGNNRWVDNQRKLEQPDLMAYAATLGLNAARVSAALAGKTHDATIFADQDLADDVGANGTPHFFINGRRLSGAQPEEKFAAVIDEELAKARDLLKTGVRPAQVYDRIMAGAKAPAPPEKKTVAAPTRDNPSRGPANAKVVIQYFGDLECPFCSRAHATMAELEKAFPGKIRIVWRNNPLAFHPNAQPAAHAAMEAFRQKGDGAFWSMVDMMFTGQAATRLERQALDGYAAQLGLDGVRFADAIDTRAHQATIDADMKIARDAGITGTPTFMINDYYVSGAQPLSKFRKVVLRALQDK